MAMDNFVFLRGNEFFRRDDRWRWDKIECKSLTSVSLDRTLVEDEDYNNLLR